MSWWTDRQGWKAQAAHLRVTVLCGAGHGLAKPLPPGLAETLLVMRQMATGTATSSRLAHLPPHDPPEARPIWEPREIRGWQINATMYAVDDEPREAKLADARADNAPQIAPRLWWLVQARRATERAPSEGAIGAIEQILEILGARPLRDAIVGPRTQVPALPFGWWTWENREPLVEIQSRATGELRIVSLGTPESDGYTKAT